MNILGIWAELNKVIGMVCDMYIIKRNMLSIVFFCYKIEDFLFWNIEEDLCWNIEEDLFYTHALNALNLKLQEENKLNY